MAVKCICFLEDEGQHTTSTNIGERTVVNTRLPTRHAHGFWRGELVKGQGGFISQRAVVRPWA